MNLVLTRYRNGEIGIDWEGSLRPAVERCFKSEEEARAYVAASFLRDYPIVRTRDFN